MTTTQFVSNVVLLSEGKLPSFASGSTKWLRIVAQGNFFLQEFATERGVDWEFYYEPKLTFGTVTATDTYTIPATARKISLKEDDTIRIQHATAYTLDGTLSGAAVTSVVVNETVPTDTPTTGYIRVLRDDGTYTKLAYSNWAVKTFTITSTDFSSNNATDGNAAFVNTLQFTDYDLIPHDELKQRSVGDYVAKVRGSLQFNQAFTASSPQYGGELLVPAYEYPATFSADGDTIDHPDSNWLVYTVAADRVKNDVTRKDLRADLIAQANEKLQSLKDDNSAQVEEVGRPWSPTGHVGEEW